MRRPIPTKKKTKKRKQRRPAVVGEDEEFFATFFFPLSLSFSLSLTLRSYLSRVGPSARGPAVLRRDAVARVDRVQDHGQMDVLGPDDDLDLVGLGQAPELALGGVVELLHERAPPLRARRQQHLTGYILVTDQSEAGRAGIFS